MIAFSIPIIMIAKTRWLRQNNWSLFALLAVQQENKPITELWACCTQICYSHNVSPLNNDMYSFPGGQMANISSIRKVQTVTQVLKRASSFRMTKTKIIIKIQKRASCLKGFSTKTERSSFVAVRLDLSSRRSLCRTIARYRCSRMNLQFVKRLVRESTTSLYQIFHCEN